MAYLATLERELRGCKIVVSGYCSSQRIYSISYLTSLIIFFNKKLRIIKMTLHFGTYHWNKNIVYGYQNTVQGCKMAFDTLFLTTPIEVALSSSVNMIIFLFFFF